MKKLLCTCLMLCLLCGTAFADVIWEPDDKFYQSHYQDCESLNRSYYTNGPEGGVALYQKPGGGYVQVLENGIPLWVSYTYKDLGGTTWGIVEYNEDWDTGWLDMADMLLIYDEQSFREEHADQLQETEQALELADLDYCVYEYPGGPLRYQAVKSQHSDGPVISLLYTDSEGREWGRCTYFYGDRNIWYCLSNLENPDLPVIEHTYDIHPAGDLSQIGRASGPLAFGSLWLIGGGITLVCGATAFLIFRMKKPK